MCIKLMIKFSVSKLLSTYYVFFFAQTPKMYNNYFVSLFFYSKIQVYAKYSLQAPFQALYLPFQLLMFLFLILKLLSHFRQPHFVLLVLFLLMIRRIFLCM